MADEERVWEAGYEGHELAQRRRLARLTLAEKLDWLEEAHRLVRRLAEATAARDRRGTTGES
jgi:hypothetical protein